jgi:hypothetical protein
MATQSSTYQIVAQGRCIVGDRHIVVPDDTLGRRCGCRVTQVGEIHYVVMVGRRTALGFMRNMM